MRRIVALLAALALLASVGAASAAAGPRTTGVNHFVGNFDMTDTNGTVIGHIHADFTEPTMTRMVPGTLDIVWEPYDVASPPFPFMPLDWPPVKESHAQLLAGSFGDEIDPNLGHGITAFTSGYLCDYTAPWNAGCREFAVIFQVFDNDGVPDRVGWGMEPDSAGQYDWSYWYGRGKGSFVLTYAGPTGG